MSYHKDDTAQHLTLTLPFPQAHFIWYCAWLSLPSAVYAYAYRYTSPTQFATYTTLIAASAASYMISHALMKRGRLWPATYAHASIHFIANVANVVLYSSFEYKDKDKNNLIVK